MRAEVLSTLEAPTVSEWRRLAVRRENPFVLPEWHETWLEAHPGACPVVIAARRADGALAGVIPLISRPGSRWLEGPGGPYADWFDPACDPADEPAVAAAAASVLDRLPGLWRCDRACESWLGELDAAVRGSRRWTLQPRPQNTVLNVADLTARVGAQGKTASELRRHGRRLRAQRWAQVRCSRTPGQADRDFDALLRLHAARWGPDHFDPQSLAFQREFARRCARRGWLRLWVLEAGGRMVAANYGWRLGSTAFGYLQAFDPEFSRYRPGAVLADHAVRAAAAEGCSAFNMLRGGEQFKRTLGAHEQPLASAAVLRRRTATRLAERSLAQAHRAWQRLPAAPRRRLRGVAS